MSLFHLDLTQLIHTIGYAGIFLIVFAESGLLIGFLFPGDSLLVTAGLLASQHYLSYPLLAVVVFVAAVAGDAVGYTFGRRVGRKIFTREGSLFFDPGHLLRAEAFYERHGGKAVILARFMPFIRTFAPIVAGVGKMSYPRFALFNTIGALLWAVGLSAVGFILGTTVPGIDKYILPIIVFIIVVSAAPALWPIISNPQERARIWGLMKRKSVNSGSPAKRTWTYAEARDFYIALLGKALSTVEPGSVMVIGPIFIVRSLEQNFAFFHAAQSALRDQGMIVFDQLPYLDYNQVDAPFEYKLKFELFYKPLIQSGKIAGCYLLPDWDKSEGTCSEIMYAHSVGVPVFELEGV